MKKIFLVTALTGLMLISGCNSGNSQSNPQPQSSSVEFFSSNNSTIIDLRTAYARLIGNPQIELQKSIIQNMQYNHIEQGNFEDILGTYEMSTDKRITADNTAVFYTSPSQTIANAKVFNVASQLANILNQDSIAVFIPNKNEQIGDIIVHFTSLDPSINDAIKDVANKLPASYSRSFSLEFNNMYAGFDQVTVKRIEWLGSSINLDEIKKAFPNEQITSQTGSAFLVYKNGKIDKL